METLRPGTSICIPVYRSAEFVGKALNSASAQTAQDIEILVSVDDGEADPDTVAVCRDAAARDPRIRIFVQNRQLNWTGNVNFLFDRIETETYSILFHDDYYDPAYIETLRTAMLSSPEAVLANCDLVWHGHPDSPDDARTSRSIAGSPLERMLDFLGTNDYVASTRGLSARIVLDRGARFTDRPFDGFAGDAVYRLRLLALGGATAVAAPLYNKWFRPGSITKKWKKWPAERLREGYVGLAGELALEIDRLHRDRLIGDDDLAALQTGARLYALERIRRTEVRDPAMTPLTHDEGPLAVPVLRAAAMIADMPEAVQPGMRQRLGNILTLEGHRARKRGELDTALERFEAAAAQGGDHAPAHAGLAVVRLRSGDRAGALAAAEHALALDSGVGGLEALKRRFDM